MPGSFRVAGVSASGSGWIPGFILVLFLSSGDARKIVATGCIHRAVSGNFYRQAHRPTMPMKCQISKTMSQAPRILLISHALGGGVEEHVADLRELLSPALDVEVLRPAGPQAVTLQCSDNTVLTWRSDDWPKLIEALAARGYSRVHVHHIHGFVPQILDLPTALGLHCDVTLHDYFPYCPVYQLNTADGKYCGEPDAAGCQACINQRPHAWGWSVLQWREAMGQFLARAQRVIAPTKFVAARMAQHFPPLIVTVHQHPPRAAWVKPPRAYTKVVLLGALSRIKGMDALIDCARQAKQADLALVFVLIGYPQHALPEGLPVQIRGQYRDSELRDLLALERADVVWFPGQFPETHSYTLDVAIASGLPIVASTRGAFTERLQGLARCTLVDADAQPEAWNAALLEAAHHGAGIADDAASVVEAQTLQALREDYARFLCQPLQGLPENRATTLQSAPDELTFTLPRGQDMALTDLFEYGVDCGKTEPRLALKRRLGEIERDYGVLEGYRLRTGKPWYTLLDEAERVKVEAETTKFEVGQLRVKSAAEIGRLTQTVAESWAALQGKQDEVQNQQQVLAERAQQISQYQEMIQSRDLDLNRAVAQIRTMERSTSWRVTAPWRALGGLFKALHRRSSRVTALVRRGFQRLPMAMQILRSQGVRALVQRVAEKLQGHPYQPPAIAVPVIVDIGVLAVVGCPEDQVPRVSLVIPVYGQHVHTFNCLKSLTEHTALADIEVIVVDDASPEPASDALAGVSGIRLVRNERNLGFIGSCHRGADLARGEFLILLNNDIQVTPGWLDALLSVFRLRADAGMVGARLVYPDGRLQEAGGIVWQDGSAWNWGRNGDPEHPAYRYLRAADYCSGACLALYRSDWVTWGGFDRAYMPAYYEDTDLAFRVRAAGKKVYYQPEAKIVHFEGVSSGTDETQGVKRHQVINREVFLDRWRTTLLAHRPNGAEPVREADRDARQHVLIVEACMITPDQDSGSVRMLAMLELLVELGHKVSFVADNLECRQPYARTLQQAGVEVWHYPYIQSVAQLLEERGKDFNLILFCRHYIAAPYMSRIRQWAPHAKIVFDTVDLHYLREQRQAELENSSSMHAVAMKTRAQELAVINQCDMTLVVSPIEQNLLATEAPGARVSILSNIHEPRKASTTYAEREGLLFIGGFRHPPNVDAVEWFVAQVWPLVQVQLPQVTLTIVGSHMPESVRALAGNGIATLGFVEDVEPLIDHARISVAPLRYGAGVKGKINQAMACGLPVVATSVAAEGMSLVAGEELLVADQPQHFADEIVRLYGDEQLWQTVAARGYDNVRRHFSRATAKVALASLLV